MNHLTLAKQLCYALHHGQTRRGGEEYYKHPFRVAGRFNNANQRMVAYLHDVLEDTNITFEELSEYGFSKEILDAVLCITKNKGESNETYYERVKSNQLARRVKIYDMIDNLSVDPTDRQIIKYAKGFLILLEGE